VAPAFVVAVPPAVVGVAGRVVRVTGRVVRVVFGFDVVTVGGVVPLPEPVGHT
jgi:hypothetical protein